MSRSRMFIFAAVALIVAAGVTAFTYRALSQRLGPADDTTQIVVAALPVSVGAKLTDADLRLAPWPRAIHIDGSFDKISDLVGRGVVVPMVPNEPVLNSKLAAVGSGAGLMSTIPDGMRAVSVKVNDVIGVAGFVVPGSRVDLILSGSPTNPGNVELAKVILENVQVLAAGQNVAKDDNGKPLSVQVVTLLVTPEQSEILALASIDGRIQLALRNPLDMEHLNPNAVRREHLFQADTAAVIKPAPRPQRPAKPSGPPHLDPPPPVAGQTTDNRTIPGDDKKDKIEKQQTEVTIVRGDRLETVVFKTRDERP